MGEGKPPFDVPDVAIPDLDLRPSKPPAGTSKAPPASSLAPKAVSRAPAPTSGPAPPVIDASPFEIERGSDNSMPSGTPSFGGGLAPSSGLDLELPGSSGPRSMQPQGARPTTSARPSGAARTAAGPSLELAYRRGEAEEEAYDDGPSLGAQILSRVVSLAGFAGAAAACFVYLHRSGGRNPMGLLPHAWDGKSMMTAAIVSVVMFVFSMTFGIWGLFSRPRTWPFVAAGGVMLLESLGMVTVALTSSGADGAPPDGALLVPWLTPTFLALVGLGVASRAAVLWIRGGWARRLATLPLGALGGAIAFVGYEISRFA